MLRMPITPALALFCLATLTLPAQAQSQPQSQSQAVAKSDAECRLSKNGEVIYNDDCTAASRRVV